MALEKNAQEIIEQFELLVDDSSELSSTEELDLLNQVYQEVCDDRPWEFLKSDLSLTTDGSTQITLPANFSYFIELDDDGRKIIWVNGDKYYIVNYNNKRQYTNQTNIAYVLNNILYFIVAPDSGLSVTGDYIKIPDELEENDTTIIPARFVKILAHGMAISDFVIQANLSDNNSIANNTSQYAGYLSRMAYYNGRLTNI